VGGDHPIVDIANLWGLFDDTATHLEAINAVRDEVIGFVEEASGGKLLHFNYFAHNYISSKKSLAGPSDFDGLRIRQHSAVLGDLVEAMGGEGQFVAFAEVYAGLERGVLDAAVTEGLAGNGQRWYEVTDYLVGPIICLGNTWVVINQERWDTLPPDIQQVFLEESERHDQELLAYAIGERQLTRASARGFSIFP
jgi:TRAP-type C4-dicarboxylate transport system substrate-binding protein